MADRRPDYTCNAFVIKIQTCAIEDSTILCFPPAIHRKANKRMAFLMDTKIYDHADARTFFLLANDPCRFLSAPKAELFNSRRGQRSP